MILIYLWTNILSFLYEQIFYPSSVCLKEILHRIEGPCFYISSISQVLWNGEPFMFLFVLNSDSFVVCRLQELDKSRRDWEELVVAGGSLGHFLSLNTFQITKKFPPPLHSLLPTRVPGTFSFCVLLVSVVFLSLSDSGKTALEEIHSFRLYKA